VQNARRVVKPRHAPVKGDAADPNESRVGEAVVRYESPAPAAVTLVLAPRLNAKKGSFWQLAHL
jgi:hypothetical protein